MSAKSNNFFVEINSESVELFFKRANHDETKNIDLEYRKSHSEAIRSGVMTEAEAKKVFAKTDAWNEQDEKQLTAMQFSILELEETVREGETEEKDSDALRKEVIELTNKRNEFITKINVKSLLFDSTAESMAERQKVHRFIQLCLRTAENNKFFEDESDYGSFVEEQNDVLSEIYKQAYYFEYGLPDDLSAGWAEVEYYKKIAEDSKKKEKPETFRQKKLKAADKKKTKKKTVEVGGK